MDSRIGRHPCPEYESKSGGRVWEESTMTKLRSPISLAGSQEVAERKQTNETLPASEHDLRQIIDTIPALAWSTHPDGSAEFFNQHYLSYAGLSLEQLQGWGWTSAVHPDDRAALAASFQSIMAAGEPGEAEARLRRFDGVYRWFLFRTNPMRDESGSIIKWFGTNTDIEDRKQAEEAVRASELKMRQVIDTIPTLAWCNLPEGSNEFLNKGWHEYTGLSPEESHVWGWQAAFHPEDLPPLMEVWREMLVSGESGEIEARLRRYDGAYRWFLIRAEPLRDEAGKIVRWYGTSTDIDDRKRAEEKLRRSEAFLAEGQHLARMGNFSWRVATDELLWSEQLYRIFEFDQGVAISLDLIASRVHPEDRRLMDDMIAKARRAVSNFEYEQRLLMPDHSVKYLHLIAHRIRDNEGRLEYIGAVQDVTQRRLSEEALAKARSELTRVGRVTSLGMLTASIAHEVNQPLSGIVTNAGTCLRMLSSDPPNIEGARETARRTIRDGNRASDVVMRLRTLFSKKEVIALSLSELQSNRVILRPEFSSILPPVTGDRVQLQQVILNLLRNASEAMSTVHDRPRELVITTARFEEDWACLGVKDVGIGFAPEAMDRLFEAFYTTKHHGMGIGLSVCWSIIEKHHGRLWATLNDGPGATFLFSIPCRTDTKVQ
jgi:PAS domain S-box-containing protein